MNLKALIPLKKPSKSLLHQVKKIVLIKVLDLKIMQLARLGLDDI
jgi:hypothetical protein